MPSTIHSLGTILAVAIVWTHKLRTAAAGTFSVNKPNYQINEGIITAFDRTTGATTSDWVGIYRADDTPGVQSASYWYYTCYSQAVCGSSVASGAITFDAATPGEGVATWPPGIGAWKAWYLHSGGYDPIGPPTVFNVAQGTFGLDCTSYDVGQDIVTTFDRTAGATTSDWVGIYHADDTPGVDSAAHWYYTCYSTSGNSPSFPPPNLLSTFSQPPLNPLPTTCVLGRYVYRTRTSCRLPFNYLSTSS